MANVAFDNPKALTLLRIVPENLEDFYPKRKYLRGEIS